MVIMIHVQVHDGLWFRHMKAAVGTPEATNPRGVRDNTEGVWWDALQPVRDHEAATGENANVPF